MNDSPENSFSFPLTIDPLRIILAVGRFIPVVILLCVIGLLAGYILDKILVPEKNKHSIKNSLMPANIRVGLDSDSFQPRDLDMPILEKLLFAPQVIQKTNERLGTNYDKDSFERNFEVEMDHQADIFVLVSHSFHSGEETLRMNRAWSESVIDYGRDLQVAEVERFTAGLNADIEDIKTQLFMVNSNLLAVSSKEALSEQGASGATGMSYEDLNRAVVGKQLDLNALNAQIQKYTRDIVAQSPRTERLKELRLQYNLLLNDYTLDNPLVIAKQQELKQQEELINQSLKLNPETLDDDELLQFTNTPLSNQLYIQLLELGRERFKIEEEITRFQSISASRLENLSKRPETKFQLTSFEQQQTDLLQKLARLESAYESGVYYKKALPGYYSTIQEPTIEDVYHQSYIKKYGKSVLLYLFCLFMFGGLALLLAIRKEFKRPGWSTPLQSAIRLRRLPTLSINTDTAKHEFREFWLTFLSRQPVGERRTLIGALGDLAETEKRLWQEIVKCTQKDQCTVLILDVADKPIDFSGSDATSLKTGSGIDEMLSPIHQSVKDGMINKSLVRSVGSSNSGNGYTFYLNTADMPLPQLNELLLQLPPETHTFVRWNTDPNAGLADLCGNIDQHISLVSPTHSHGAEATSRDRILKNILGPSAGLVLLDRNPRDPVHRFIVWYENAFFDWKKSQAEK